ncbi:CpsD/CapB family tyrosine-protein kinase [Proteinivorax tanatarense]|uniref:non-specific protein-tyrosine kinase n=1 Tax=Proteinivorax tanatarense TaxID=1260629 RepID=A0AAU7VSK0_9FIRM
MMQKLDIVTHAQPKSPISEAYRTLRTNIQFSSLDKPVRTIMVTSSGPGEGKTTTSVNLATALAQTEEKVVIVDADLRKPRIHKIFKAINSSGVTNILVNDLDYKKDVIVTEVDNLDLITAGTTPPNPSEILSSQKMKNFIRQLKEDYDYVIIDTPPSAIVTDAAILSQNADGVLLVCASGQVAIDGAQKAKELLTNVNANILGVVLNKIPVDDGSYYAQYYYSDYYEDSNDYKQKASARAKRRLEK